MKSNAQQIGIAVLRIAVGLVFLAHGSQKVFVWGIGGVAHGFGQAGIPLPFVSAVLATSAEFLGGLALLLGLVTRLAAIPVAFTMLVAVLKVHLHGGFFLPTGFEYAFTLLLANIALVFTGSGAFALDNLLFSKAPERLRAAAGAA